jgi:hypothetical protein
MTNLAEPSHADHPSHTVPVPPAPILSTSQPKPCPPEPTTIPVRAKPTCHPSSNQP